MNIYKYIKRQKQNNRKLLAILLDPDKVDLEEFAELIKRLQKINADLILVGGSLIGKQQLKKLIKRLQKHCQKPVIIFPGSNTPLVNKADAIMFLSLISGRNPDFLIGKQVETAPILAGMNLEIIPTGYMLIENGKMTSVEYISQTKPIPRKKTDIALATALAGQMLGLKMLYLEAGSGAKKPVPLIMIQKLSQYIKLPLMVGGGIKNRKQMLKAWNAGADIVVVGTAFENNTF